MKRLALIILLCLPAPAVAELYECNGTWTNKPCENPAEVKATKPALKEKPARVRSKEKTVRSEKESLLHELRMKKIRAKREHNISVRVSPAEVFCMDSSTSLEDCLKNVEEIEQKIDSRVTEAKALALKEKEVEEKKTETENSGKTNVIVVDDTRRRHHRHSSGVTVGDGSGTLIHSGETIIHKNGHSSPHHHSDHGHIDHRPHGGSTHSSHTHDSGSASISLGGQSKDGRLSVGVRAGGHSSTHSSKSKTIILEPTQTVP